MCSFFFNVSNLFSENQAGKLLVNEFSYDVSNDFIEYDGTCFRSFGDQLHTFEGARDICASANAHLPEFRTLAEWESLKQAVEDNGHGKKLIDLRQHLKK